MDATNHEIFEEFQQSNSPPNDYLLRFSHLQISKTNLSELFEDNLIDWAQIQRVDDNYSEEEPLNNIFHTQKNEPATHSKEIHAHSQEPLKFMSKLPLRFPENAKSLRERAEQILEEENLSKDPSMIERIQKMAMNQNRGIKMMKTISYETVIFAIKVMKEGKKFTQADFVNQLLSRFENRIKQRFNKDERKRVKEKLEKRVYDVFNSLQCSDLILKSQLLQNKNKKKYSKKKEFWLNTDRISQLEALNIKMRMLSEVCEIEKMKHHLQFKEDQRFLQGLKKYISIYDEQELIPEILRDEPFDLNEFCQEACFDQYNKELNGLIQINLRNEEKKDFYFHIINEKKKMRKTRESEMKEVKENLNKSESEEMNENELALNMAKKLINVTETDQGEKILQYGMERSRSVNIMDLVSNFADGQKKGRRPINSNQGSSMLGKESMFKMHINFEEQIFKVASDIFEQELSSEDDEEKSTPRKKVKKIRKLETTTPTKKKDQKKESQQVTNIARKKSKKISNK